MRRTTIRLKLAMALAVPMVGLVAVTLIEVVDTSAELRHVRQQSELALATTGPGGLLTALQNERAWPAAELVGLADVLDPPVRSYQEAWDATDAAIEAFEDDLASRPAVVQESYAEAMAGLDALQSLRADVDANAAPRDMSNMVFSDSIFTRYTDLIEPFFDATARIAVEVGDADLQEGALLIDITARQTELLAQLFDTLISDSAFSDGIAGPSEVMAISFMRSDLEANAARLRLATGAYADIVAADLPEDLLDRVAASVDATIGAGLIEDSSPIVAAFATPGDAGFIALRDALGTEIEERADSVNAAAEARQRAFVGLAALALAATTVLVLTVSRSITRPLRSLTQQATDMAHHRLPDAVRGVLGAPLGEDVVMPKADPIEVQTRDEVADVAKALNVVLDTALELAVEQAVLRRNIADSFVNLGRRNQNLLGRQIDFINSLESQEPDPDALANLFRLDHIATRMRRNAESLLVLAGVDPPRQWAAPVPIDDVVRAALSEVEDFDRVVMGQFEPSSISGSAVADLAHLLAELIENALVFSPPDRAVVLHGTARGDRYALAVVDQGEGMSPQGLEAANLRLAGGEQYTVAPSRYLGHYVAARLAARHGLVVRLEPTLGGITAVVTVPPALTGRVELERSPVVVGAPPVPAARSAEDW